MRGENFCLTFRERQPICSFTDNPNQDGYILTNNHHDQALPLPVFVIPQVFRDVLRFMNQ